MIEVEPTLFTKLLVTRHRPKNGCHARDGEVHRQAEDPVLPRTRRIISDRSRRFAQVRSESEVGMKMVIRFTRAEATLLTRFKLWPAGMSDKIISQPDAITLEMSQAEASNLRERVADQLMMSGFDENYEPTADGRLMEDLIDKLGVESPH